MYSADYINNYGPILHFVKGNFMWYCDIRAGWDSSVPLYSYRQCLVCHPVNKLINTYSVYDVWFAYVTGRQTGYGPATIFKNDAPDQGTENKTHKKSEQLVVEFHDNWACALVSNLPNTILIFLFQSTALNRIVTCAAPRTEPRYVNPRRTGAEHTAHVHSCAQF